MGLSGVVGKEEACWTYKGESGGRAAMPRRIFGVVVSRTILTAFRTSMLSVSLYPVDCALRDERNDRADPLSDQGSHGLCFRYR